MHTMAPVTGLSCGNQWMHIVLDLPGDLSSGDFVVEFTRAAGTQRTSKIRIESTRRKVALRDPRPQLL